MIRLQQQVERARNRTEENEQTQLLAKLQSDIIEMEKENLLKSKEITNLEMENLNLKEKLNTAEQSFKKQNQEYLDFHDKEISKLQKESESLLKEKELEWG